MKTKKAFLVIFFLFLGIGLMGCDDDDRSAPRVPPYNEPYVTHLLVDCPGGVCEKCHPEEGQPPFYDYQNVSPDFGSCNDCHIPDDEKLFLSKVHGTGSCNDCHVTPSKRKVSVRIDPEGCNNCHIPDDDNNTT